MKQIFRTDINQHLVEIHINKITPEIEPEELYERWEFSYITDEKIGLPIEEGQRNGKISETLIINENSETEQQQTYTIEGFWQIIPEIFRLIDWEKNHLPEETLTDDLLITNLGIEKAVEIISAWEHVYEGSVVTMFLIADQNDPDQQKIFDVVWEQVQKYERRIYED